MSTAKRKSIVEEFDTRNATPKKKGVRHRAALACEECRARKRRCDGATPACGGCMKRTSVCVYSSEIQTKMWRNSMILSLRTRLEELEKEDDSVPGLERLISRNDASISASTRHLSPAVEASGDAVGNEDVQPLRPIKATFPTVLSSASQDQSSIGADTVHSQRQPGITSGSRSPNDYNARSLEPCSVEKLMKPIDQAIDSRKGQNNLPAHPIFPANATICGPTRISVTSCSCDQLLGASRWRLPLRSTADDLVALYFARVNRMYPILHERTFRKQYECLWQSTARTSTTIGVSCSGLCKQKSKGKTFPAMVHAVFALASLFEAGSPEQNIPQADDYFRLSQEIDLLDVLDYEVGIELVQLGLLMGFYLQSTERFSKCWNITGLTIRMAQNMGLQLKLCEARRKGLFAPLASQLDCEMRVRVWYGCVLLDREISMSFGRPLMIVNNRQAVRLPTSIDDNRLSEELGTCNVQSTSVPSLLESYVRTIRLYDILKIVLDREELKDSLNKSPDIQSLLRLDTMIMEWRDALPSYLQYDPLSEGTISGEQHIPGMTTTQTDFSAQAKRLYARFLHVRVLILRPALDLLFQKQQHPTPSVNKRSMEAKVQDLMLSDIATQCASSAHNLIKILDAQISMGSLVAWWYNISYLHTCGSTLLMAQLSTLNDMALSSQLSGSWDTCLQCISRYAGVSSIAKKSVRLLEKSRQCLLADGFSQRAILGHDLPATSPAMTMLDGISHLRPQHIVPQSKATSAHETYQLNKDLLPINNAGESFFDQDWHFTQPKARTEQQFLVDEMTESASDAPHYDGTNGILWADETCASSYWPFMPYLSQLETLPSDFDPSNLE
ncbi:fungal-specific transcription factor domain-containing protein [Penicillium longicatenatum]|uniref:fungal-specific transcription factor domain-containing protein n=1 Tax=Penicillium longicatenatum TaxID=1561947 RepID=UPI0025479153|nr:fungal-specific transcription factor domain-containing protein [Penicillium longicatenatum]KAJ5636946.1 fungal-specific transcription factor domain-containing protein [Penicillium longicatenatum]